MLKEGTISADDLRFIKFTDDPNEAMEHLAKYISEFYTIKKKRRRYWALGEKRTKFHSPIKNY
jgi:predicted Rossmann-fold nucleotide-binding protein